MMNSLFSYLKNFETKLTASEVPELQFLDEELYKNDGFNVNSLVQIIMSKLNETNYLIDQLKLTKENLKNEIVDQINSNFNNYITLISKLQSIDFMIENIDKPLQNIKKVIYTEINYIEKYEDELITILGQMNNYSKEIKIITVSLQFYKLYHKTKLIMQEINHKYENNLIINNILANHPEEYFIDKGNYDYVRKYLVDLLRFISPVQNIYDIYKNYLKEENHCEIVNEIRQEETKHFINVEDLLKILLNEYIGNSGNILKDKQHRFNLMRNLLFLIFKVYFYSNNKELVFSKILENILSNDISSIFDKNKNISKCIDELQVLYDKKYKDLHHVIIESSSEDFGNSFYIHCFLFQMINKVNNDKFIFNCVDPHIFRENYNSIVTFINKFINVSNINYIKKENLLKIKSFIHSFSFFTYFQYLQNEISKLFLDEFNKSSNIKSADTDSDIQNNDNNFHFLFENYLNKNLISNSNLLFNFTKLILEIFKEKKIFCKIIPNFLNFISQCNKFIIKKQTSFFENENSIKLINLVKLNNTDTEQNNFSFENSNMSSIRKNLLEYMNNLNNYINYFITDEEKSFSLTNDLNQILYKENFLMNSVEEFNLFKEKINKFRQTMKSNFMDNLKYNTEGSFIKELMNCDEIKKDMTCHLV